MLPGIGRPCTRNMFRCTHDCCGRKVCTSRGQRDHHSRFQEHPKCTPECHKFDSYNQHWQKMQMEILRRRRVANVTLCDAERNLSDRSPPPPPPFPYLPQSYQPVVTKSRETKSQ
eukprot:67474_1